MRELPHNFEAEQSVLGAILVNNSAMALASEHLDAEHFADETHRHLFATLSTMIERGQVVNMATLKAFAESDDKMQAAGGAKYLARLMASSVHALDVSSMAKAVREVHQRRSLVQVLQDALPAVYDDSNAKTPADLVADLERQLLSIGADGLDGGYRSFQEVAEKTVELAEAAYHRGGELIGLPTGLTELDALLGGLHPGELIILAGRPSQGKTALATNIAYRASRTLRTTLTTDGVVNSTVGVTAGIVSLEMNDHDLLNRILADQANVPATRVRSGELSSVEMGRFFAAADAGASSKLFIDQQPAQTVSTVRARARRLKRTHGLGLLVVDYLQLLEGSGKRDGRVQEVSEITRALKALAKELSIPVLALSQLSRKVEERTDKRPQLSDLRESGSIEQDADVVMFVYREEYYLERSNKRDSSEHDAVRGKAEIIVAKQRHGPTGTAFVGFDGRFTRFCDAPSEPSERYSAMELSLGGAR